jgi:uncharacterized protein (TIGR02421 family)
MIPDGPGASDSGAAPPPRAPRRRKAAAPRPAAKGAPGRGPADRLRSWQNIAPPPEAAAPAFATEDRGAYRSWLLRVSRALVRAQLEIRLLKTLHWPDAVAQRFFASGGRELPDPPTPELGFDPRAREREFLEIERALDPGDPLQEILRQTALQYVDLIAMLEARGTPAFHEISSRLYGHPLEPFVGQTTTNLDLAIHLDRILGPRSGDTLQVHPPNEFTAEEAAVRLEKRMRRNLGRRGVTVEVSNDLTADAAAGSAKLKIKRGRMFGRDTLDYLEQHEGYVHIATTLNGREQPWLPILGKASPRATRVNEGLAVFAEWASHTITVRRMRRLLDRVLAIRMAEEGADFLQVYRNFLERGEDPGTAFDIARRVFRGGDLRGGAPFTKDASYLGDFLRIFNFCRIASKRRRLDLLDLLFVGKVTIADMPVLADRLRTGEVAAARHLPPWARDKNWLASHMALSSFLNQIELRGTEAYYEELFARCP